MSLVPRWKTLFQSPMRRPSELYGLGRFFEDFENNFQSLASNQSGLSVSSDEKNVYIEANVPGLTAKDIEVSVENDNLLWIKGNKREEIVKGRHYFRESQSSFSYCVPLWEEIDVSVEPKATCKDGIMKIAFPKKKEQQIPAKKIKVQED